ncbi:gag_pre-integrs domain-containing protein/UBN2_3 domain-containing protein [Cephalotus follicularis]|uniref:Gag_pre-integrs domain-containing protein/UBN2_3 domain-containing protein n=1 Tax=Cephalotus follicularis TaxID=3775 RepID=A0A1Q3BN91_CEPFO|nr:gag_pre-integrs domain-containing protein/UBN2_3 domain-containing protein [Cephalotus follicularis]
MLYLINSMYPTVARGYLLMDSSTDIWTSAEKTFSKKKDISQCYEIRKKLGETKHKEMSVFQYYSTLKALWLELDYYGPFNAIDPTNVVAFQEWQDNHRLFDFLAGLNMEFEPIRAQMLSTKPLPSLEDAFSSILSEDTRMVAMALPAPQERSALYNESTITNVLSRGKTSDTQTRPGDKKKPQHSPSIAAHSATIPSLDGQHVSLPFSSDQMQVLRNSFTKEYASSSSDVSATSAMSRTGPSDKMQVLRNLFAKEYASSSSDVSEASTMSRTGPSDTVLGNHSCGLSTLFCNPSPWIIDSGATDHMTGNSGKFLSISPSHSSLNVTTADGSRSPISGHGNVHLSNFSLPFVLHVPKLTHNLISISSLTKELNCKVTVFPTHCIFQDLVSGHRIGKVTITGGLYLLDETQSIMTNHATRPSTSSSLAEIKRWHHRLGHPPFSVLSSLFPTLCCKFLSVSHVSLQNKPVRFTLFQCIKVHRYFP